MTEKQTTCPMNRQDVISRYFMENRAKVLDVAAFLDRVDRATDKEEPDFRLDSFRQAVKILAEKEPGRAARLLDLFSDTSSKPIESAAGMKGADGAPRNFSM